ncbi:MAG TPA: hypothetical protein VGC78_08230 [Gaiellaceae bacterium]
MIRSLAAAAAWVDEVGLALLFPKADVVLPSLWQQVAGDTDVRWPSPEMAFLWPAKDELAQHGLVCVGRHLGGSVSCIAPRLVPTLVAANGDAADAGPVAEAVRELGPLTGPEVRRATGLDKKTVDRAIASLHRRLVLTSSHLVETSAWGAVAHELVERKWPLPATLPSRDDARRSLARVVLEQSRELTAADLAGALGWRRRDAAAVLEAVADGRDDEAGFRIWTRR